jgi:sigma-54 dependent transcriptional regulator, acetoin dehydrogenase operon transcriptional activator AcoR
MSTALFANRDDRVLSAKRRYFENGTLPTGLVSEAILKSWARCNLSQQRPVDSIAFQAITKAQTQHSEQKNRILFAAWLKELPAISNALGSTHCSAILTDEKGVLIDVSRSETSHLKIIPTAHRAGVQLSEDTVGTCAPGIVLQTSKPACVMGAEHYFDAVTPMYCAAAPILNTQGQLAGVLNISSEGRPFYFDPTTIVSMYAASIENRVLTSQSPEHLIVSFQFLPSLIDTPMAGILAFNLSGTLAWGNSAASQLLGIRLSGMSLNQEQQPERCVEDFFDRSFAQLASLAGRGVVSAQLRNGLQLFLVCALPHPNPTPKRFSVFFEPQTGDVANITGNALQAATIAVSTSIPIERSLVGESLKQIDAQLIQKYLSQYKGNISQVAKKLKVSRGLIYRRLTELETNPVSSK